MAITRRHQITIGAGAVTGAVHALATLACVLLGACVLSAQSPPADGGRQGGTTVSIPMPGVPFGVGERLTYRVNVARGGKVGSSTLVVEKQAALRGRNVYVLRSEVRARKGPISATELSESWLDPVRMTSLRFRKQGRHPFWSTQEAVEVFPEERRWEGRGGEQGESLTDLPLDELSFIYFVRTLRLTEDDTLTFNRHFDSARNPTRVTVVGRGTFVLDGTQFQTLVVEMRVRDPKRYKNRDGIIRIELTDDYRRLPVRIESSMPIVGATVLTLESHVCPTRLEDR